MALLEQPKKAEEAGMYSAKTLFFRDLLRYNMFDTQHKNNGGNGMKITICIGSSCHVKGSRQVIEELKRLVEEHQLKEQIDMGGQFCMGNCTQGVCVTVDGELFSVQPDTVQSFFDKEVLPRLAK